MAISKPVCSVPSQAAAPSGGVDSFAVAYPTTWEYLTLQVYADGSKRQTSSLLLFTDGGMFKTMLKDRDLERVAFVAGSSVSQALERLEEGLQREQLDWRADRPAKRGKS